MTCSFSVNTMTGYRDRTVRGQLFEAGRLIFFSTVRVGAYSRWALIRGWALNRINTVFKNRYNKRSVKFKILLPEMFSAASSPLTSSLMGSPLSFTSSSSAGGNRIDVTNNS